VTDGRLYNFHDLNASFAKEVMGGDKLVWT
jgi:hypothetical protein